MAKIRNFDSSGP